MGPYNTVTGNHYIYNHASDIALWRISTGRRHHPLYHIGIGSKSAQWWQHYFYFVSTRIFVSHYFQKYSPVRNKYKDFRL